MAEIEFWLRTESELNESGMCGNRFKLKNELLVHMFWCIWMSVSFSVRLVVTVVGTLVSVVGTLITVVGTLVSVVGTLVSVVGTLVSVVGTLVSALSHWLQ